MLLKFFYIYGVGCGLVPAPLEEGKFLVGHSQRWYLIYTACLHGVLLILMPFAFPQYMYEESYMRSNSVLQWAFNLTNITRIMAISSGGYMMWFKRRKLLRLGEQLLNHCQKCKKVKGHSTEYMKLRKRFQIVLAQVFVVTNLSLLFGTLILMEIDTGYGIIKGTMIVSHISQYIYVIVMTAGVCVIFLVLQLQSERTLIALKDLCSLLNHEERNSLVLTESKSKKSLNKLRILFHHFAENQLLLREVFETFDFPIAFLLLKLFVTNVNLVYHGVQFGNRTIETSLYTRVVGQCVIITHYWSASLLMNIVDNVTRRSGLKLGNILRRFSHMELIKREFQLELELFSDYLRCHRLTYKVCGLFVFNKQTSLVYFFYVLVQVLVLVQFDMKKKVDEAHLKVS
ncbi:putative gustatory receptor 58a [Drosophila eugracilis]|uniref:putative gustatory receptor 58a n=1 Tax=Drosophila eugracilis TaxID=29029 RepID=UPI0007E86F23|nr:putative gustatory receptor 58a [Drosophila eugracilis]